MVDLTRFDEVGKLAHSEMDANWMAIENALNALKEMSTRDRAAVAEILAWSGDAGLTSERIATALAWVTLTDAATIAVDFETFFNAAVTLAGNRALGNPSNVNTMAARQIYVVGNDATARTLTFGANYKGDLPTLTDITSTKGYLIGLQPRTSSHIIVTAVRAL